MKLLYIEDSPLQIRTMSKVAAMADYEFLSADSGHAGLVQLESDPDVVLVDIGLPDVDGLILAAQIHRMKPALPIVAISAGTLPYDKERAIAAGCVDYIRKPYGFMEMVEYLRKLESTQR